MVRGNPLFKFIWIAIFPFLYIVRGVAMRKEPIFWEYVNLMTSFLTNVFVYSFGGWSALGYLLLSMYFGYTLHPAAAHFIQEHYTWTDGQETYSYYGPLNKIFMNIGMHVEHHDFTKVSWSKLPQVKSIAAQFYDPLYAHTSWVRVYWDFITSNSLGPQSRLSRPYDAHKYGRKMILSSDH